VTEDLAAKGLKEKIDFIFDSQPDQMDVVMASWKRFATIAPPEVQAILGDPPIFRNDKTNYAFAASRPKRRVVAHPGGRCHPR
jgi:hypothetical protein